ncbi:type VI secretion system Vgr family protein [Burkholderia cepacia]|uniref:type VI secretion system Vgr family protein n=2 Tax=Burkholderia cepacia TaxID=292 RepID=UPI000F58DE2E|nr:type VI secretion system tip protein VgrG [Burkholderia cepacia]RQT73104.1 type VI secretion system tip protein VgrG [Burkholderia cepacia]RQT92907.1 type VI secretion system tip protein VgrG [Burkholderia cepacia]RQZ70298.1 type VI secretion system tip protein VgrG [Burkholderia cepacia]RQZ92812.1 type VI secretion system tip protein VgrG [Burkholderia cepacia]RQZ97086.1 type VI secretion system tip protein VgrG [Burkholderia cepacia]
MRLIELRSSLLDPNAFALSFVANEKLSQEPSYRLEVLSSDPDLDYDALLGSSLSADIDLGDGTVRTFNTYVFGGADTGQMSGQYTYTLDLASWLSFLAENRNSRIFQNLSVPQIVEQVFQAHQRNDYRFELKETYAPREYCVQFQETDLNFVKRLLESEGIYFWVEHSSDSHVVVMSDTQQFEDLALPDDTLAYLPDGEESRAIQGREGVQRLQRTRRIRSNSVALRDFDYLAPSNLLDSDAQAVQPGLEGIQLEYYDYAAGYGDTEQGERLAQLRLQAFQAEAQMLVGEANVRALATARAFTLSGYPAARRNRRYYVTGSELTFIQDGPDSTSQGRNVAVKFQALADDQLFSPLLVTKQPRVPGIQSATVVGPEVSEVHTDSLGRIRVHFQWDRYSTTEADASCWIRVSQAWAGKGWGVLAMPRVGQEVLVTYVDGDLDRPLVTGIVYNGDNPTPYNLPQDTRYTGIVSRSLKTPGTVQNASQLTFDDQLGAERVMIHAERDLQQTVERNISTAVGQDSNTAVAGTATNNHNYNVSYYKVSVSYVGLSVGFTGVSASFTGLSVSKTGVSTNCTGVSTSFTGVGTTFSGVSTSFTGLSTNFSGVSTSFNGIGTTITGTSNSVTGVSNSMTGISSSMIGVSTSMTGQSQSMTGVALSFTGSSNSMTGASTSVAGTSTSITGVSTSNTGSSTSTTGSSVSITGTSMGVTGLNVTTTGVSMGTSGLSMSTTGSKFSTTGLSFSYTGISYSDEAVDLRKRLMEMTM